MTKRSKTSIEKPKIKKSLKTYGKSSQDIFEFHGGSDGELDNIVEINLGHKPEKRKSNDKRRIDRAASRRSSQDEGITRTPSTSSGGDAELLSTEPKGHEVSSAAENEGSLRSSMPPPASKSTSLSESQRSQTDSMDAINDPAPRESSGTDALSPAVVNTSGAHLVDRMSAPTRPSGGEVNEKILGQLHSNEPPKLMDFQSTEKSASNSSALKILPSKVVTVEGTHGIQIAGKDFTSHLENEPYIDSPLDPKLSIVVNAAVLQPAPSDTEGARDELSLFTPEAASENAAKQPKAAKRKRDADDEPLDEFGSDDNALGVPKERYQPRPSKRRSDDGNAEIIVPADFSKRPEAIGKGKRKTKRHKTTAFQELLPKDEEDEEVKVIPDSRFEIPKQKTPKSFTESAQLEADRSETIEETRTETQPEPNQTAKSTGQKKRGRPKKAVTSLSEEPAMDEVEADHDQNGAETEQQVISAAAKKPRKRDKIRETAMPIIDEQDSNNATALVVQDGSEAPSANANILNDTNGNINPRKLPTDSSPSTSPVKANAPPETPHKSTTPAPKGPDKHSPISIGKVSYRVGLSKRARIAPLLRIVRK